MARSLRFFKQAIRAAHTLRDRLMAISAFWRICIASLYLNSQELDFHSIGLFQAIVQTLKPNYMAVSIFN